MARQRTRTAEEPAAPKRSVAVTRKNPAAVAVTGALDAGGELASTMAAANKRYGDGAVRLASTVRQPGRISSGIFVIDYALMGGWPESRVSMVVGEKHAGKTMMACKAIAGAQRKYPDMMPVFMDIEGTFDPVWAAALGVDLDQMVHVECETGEQAVDVADAMVNSKETSIIVIDSIAALTPMREIENSAEDSLVGAQARMTGGMIRKVTAAMIKERKRNHMVAVMFLNQFRSKIGGFSPNGEARSLPGGKAVEYCTSVQMTLRNKENKSRGDAGLEVMGFNEHPYTISKNKCNQGPRQGEFTLIREDQEDSGLQPGQADNAPTIIAYAKRMGYFTGGGKSWTLAVDDISMKVGKTEEAIQALRDDPEIERRVWNFLIAEQAVNQKMPTDFVESLLAME